MRAVALTRAEPPNWPPPKTANPRGRTGGGCRTHTRKRLRHPICMRSGPTTPAFSAPQLRDAMTKRLTRRRKVVPIILPDPRQARAAMLDRLADQQLQAGFHYQAERLAHRAAEMREDAR